MATIYKKSNGLIWKTTIPNSNIIRVWEGTKGKGCVEYIRENGDHCDVEFDSITGHKKKPDAVIRKHRSIVSELKQIISEYENRA